jgi:hypothetical protein
VKRKETPNLLDGVRIPLRGRTRLHDQLGLDGRDMSARVLDDAVVALLHRPDRLDGDDGVGVEGAPTPEPPAVTTNPAPKP